MGPFNKIETVPLRSSGFCRQQYLTELRRTFRTDSSLPATTGPRVRLYSLTWQSGRYHDPPSSADRSVDRLRSSNCPTSRACFDGSAKRTARIQQVVPDAKSLSNTSRWVNWDKYYERRRPEAVNKETHSCAPCARAGAAGTSRLSIGCLSAARESHAPVQAVMSPRKPHRRRRLASSKKMDTA
jgi:hypothetical protein